MEKPSWSRTEKQNAAMITVTSFGVVVAALALLNSNTEAHDYIKATVMAYIQNHKKPQLELIERQGLTTGNYGEQQVNNPDGFATQKTDNPQGSTTGGRNPADANEYSHQTHSSSAVNPTGPPASSVVNPSGPTSFVVR